MKIENLFSKIILWISSILYLAGLCLLWAAPYWPAEFWWIANLVLIGPLFLLFIPLTIFALIAFSVNQKTCLVIHIISFFILFIGIMGFNIPFNQKDISVRATTRVLTANIGEISELDALMDYIKKTQPDIIAFQEVTGSTVPPLKHLLSNAQWHFIFQDQLGVASQLKIRNFEVKNRRLVGGWGGLVGKCVLEGSTGPINFFNVHFETPRDGVEAIIEEQAEGLSDMKEVTAMQQAEANMISDWIMSHERVLVAGDFNMLVNNPLYKKFWSSLTNAFSKKGFGFGYTKYTSFYGARIDHLLTDNHWKIIGAQVGPDINGDHRPLLVDIALLKKPSGKSTPQHNRKQDADLAFKIANSYFFETFELSLGEFANYGEIADLSLEYKTVYTNGNSLRIQTRSLTEPLWAGIEFNPWSIERFPILDFAYNIPKGVAVSMRVKTQFGDWICLGGTSTSQCPNPGKQTMYSLKDDGQWHEIHMDVKSFVKHLLPGIRDLKAFEFYSDQKQYLSDKFWIDDFSVNKK